MKNKFRVEVEFIKNRHYPQYGSEAYSMERESVMIPYGKNKEYKTSKAAIDYAKKQIDESVLSMFDRVSIVNWRGYNGTSEQLKNNTDKSDAMPIDRAFIGNLFGLNK
jgi:hypothetical protein